MSDYCPKCGRYHAQSTAGCMTVDYNRITLVGPICHDKRPHIEEAEIAAYRLLDATARVFVEHVRRDYLDDGPGCSGLCARADEVRDALAALDAIRNPQDGKTGRARL